MTDRKDEIDDIFQDEPKPESLRDQFEKELELQTQPENTEIQPEVVQKAKSFGHLDKEAWIQQGRDPNQWKSPEEFVRYGEQYKEFKDLVSELKKQNESQSKKIDMLVEDRKRLAEQAVLEAKQQLEMQLREARQRGDIDSVEHLAQQRVKLEQQNQQTENQRKIDEVRQIDQLFMSRNGHWFNDSHPELKSKAQEISNQLTYMNPGISYAQLAIQTEERMRLMHPELYVNNSPASRPQVSMSDSTINKSTAESGSSTEERLYRSLTPEERAEYNVTKKLVSGLKTAKGITYTVQEYIQQRDNLKKREA